VLSRVVDVVELSGSRTDTECCGGAGLLPKTMPEVADSMARRRLREVAGRGGGTVVTSCATCAFMLRRNAPSGVTVLDLPAAVAGELGDGESGRSGPG
jgi:Fe-S oxidoreductase